VGFQPSDDGVSFQCSISIFEKQNTVALFVGLPSSLSAPNIHSIPGTLGVHQNFRPEDVNSSTPPLEYILSTLRAYFLHNDGRALSTNRQYWPKVAMYAAWLLNVAHGLPMPLELQTKKSGRGRKAKCARVSPSGVGGADGGGGGGDASSSSSSSGDSRVEGVHGGEFILLGSDDPIPFCPPRTPITCPQFCTRFLQFARSHPTTEKGDH
jgi:hypothetical protein